MIDKLDLENLQSTVQTPGWKYLVAEFAARKWNYQLLIMDCNLDTADGLANAKAYQAMYHTTDAFLENVQDMLHDDIKEEGNGESILD